MLSNNSTVSHLSEYYGTSSDYQENKENKIQNIQKPTFQQFCDQYTQSGLNSISNNLTQTLSQIQETENSLYNTLYKSETTENQKQQIQIRLIKLQMLSEIASFKLDTNANLMKIQMELQEIQLFIKNEVLKY